MSDDTGSGDDFEAARLAAVQRYRAAVGPFNPVFDRMTEVIAQFFDAPYATVSLVDESQIWYVAAHGLTGLSEVDRFEGLCASAIGDDAPYVVSDTRGDVRTADLRFVREYGIGFYACVPLKAVNGHRVGALSVMDTRARVEPSPEQLAVLVNLAVVVVEQLELRLSAFEALKAERTLRGVAEADRDGARQDRDTAVRDRDSVALARDQVESDRDEARRDRDEARRDRDEARLDRDTAERERDDIGEYATALQQIVLPPVLPRVEGLTLAAHHRPASPRHVGGDFYDVFPLGADRWGLFIGDVQGHGVEAATLTSLIRYTLRSATLHYPDPRRALAELNRVMLSELAPRRFCSVLLVTLQPRPGGGFDVALSTGGHTPALLLDPDIPTATPVRSRIGMLVGATPNATFDTYRTELRPGQTLLLYTDGLVEARRGTSPFDQESLQEFAAARAGLGAAALVDDLATLIPKLNPADDVAVLALTADLL
ncbi:PP2C family protein-serine/threonine phosphatase [Mycobacterium sp. WMMD1722]|uniref:PP2C family protein-serine/threonine phosphatase n=1 Tax=Mycobacterium sp. WMMD1722 TaxID=3404117 RepID=UPI003BF46818